MFSSQAKPQLIRSRGQLMQDLEGTSTAEMSASSILIDTQPCACSNRAVRDNGIGHVRNNIRSALIQCEIYSVAHGMLVISDYSESVR